MYQNIYKRANIKIIHCIVTRPVSVLISSLLTFLCLVSYTGYREVQSKFGRTLNFLLYSRAALSKVDLKRKHREVMDNIIHGSRIALTSLVWLWHGVLWWSKLVWECPRRICDSDSGVLCSVLCGGFLGMFMFVHCARFNGGSLQWRWIQMVYIFMGMLGWAEYFISIQNINI